MKKCDRVRVVASGTLGYGMEGIVNDFLYDQDFQIHIVEVKFPGEVVNLYFDVDLQVIGGDHDKITEEEES